MLVFFVGVSLAKAGIKMTGNKRQQIGKMKVNIYVYEMTNDLGLFKG